MPLHRGIHICSDTFKRAFKTCYKQDSSILASYVLTELDDNRQKDFFVKNDSAEQPVNNMLFSARMFELLYARDIFDSAVRTEGSFTNARAMAQLRQYYIRMVDLKDSYK